MYNPIMFKILRKASLGSCPRVIWEVMVPKIRSFVVIMNEVTRVGQSELE